MPAAVAVPFIIGAASAGASVASAKMGSNAANKASQQQQQASNQALNFQRDVFNQQTAAISPYMNFGQQGMDRYSQRYGGQPSPAPNQGMGLGGGGGVPLNFGQPSIGQRQPMGGGGQMQQQPGGQMADGGMVQMRGPDGDVRAVPISMKARALAAGAVEV